MQLEGEIPHMTEKIGKVTLDLSLYPGEDFYCDGTVEDEILEIVKNHPREEYQKKIEEKRSWPVFYHLSPQRENIVSWLPMDKNTKILEVGSGMGAITGVLAEKAGSVTCVDLSKKRSTINAYRNQERDNVTIHVGNFNDIEPTLPCDFDYVLLIGVFEYGQSYIPTETPFEDFMKINLRHVKSGGNLVIAGCPFCAGAGAGGADRMAVYCHNERFLAMEELVPLHRAMTQPNVSELAYDSVYMANVSELEMFYKQTIRYVDGI